MGDTHQIFNTFTERLGFGELFRVKQRAHQSFASGA
jgi:hypothetical protein